MIMNQFINLHTNSEYSILESSISLEKLIFFAKENKLKSLALTDHNTMYGTIEFFNLCNKNGIKPIVGIDLDVENFQLILIAKNYEGYLEIIRLSSKKMLKYEINVNEINSENLFIIDHPSNGPFSKFKKNLNLKNYYINDLSGNAENAIFIKEIKIIEKDDNNILSTLHKISTGLEKKFNLSEYETELEMPKNVLKNIEFIIENSNLVFPEKYPNFLPKYNKKRESKELLKEIVYLGLENKKSKLLNFQNVEKRIEYELKIINDLNFANYFLIIYDIVKFAKENKISVGPGRGSAAGSIVSFLLNITTINPLKYDLLFERFLNPERATMPDIDIDFQDDRRDEIVEYVTKKYGQNNVALIVTFQRFGAKMALRDVGRNLGFSQIEMNNLSKLVKLNQNLEEAYKSSKFKSQIISSPRYEKLYKESRKIENFPRQVGTHAAGIVIANQELHKIIPIMQSSVSNIQTQYSMNFLEKFNLFKIDLLGLKTLSTIKLIENQIKKTYQKKFNFTEEKEYKTQLKKDLNIQKANFLLSEGNTAGIFQLESPGMMQTIKKVKINHFNDLVDVISLYRPGPMQYISEYIENKNNPSKIKVVEKTYDEIVFKTHGIIIYQEQIMQIVQKFAGLPYSQADILRRAISKKNPEEIAKFKTIFIKSSLEKEQNEKIANEIFDKIENFAQYGFNKSHAVAYATITYYMAQLKSSFPLEFYTVLISSSDSLETVNKYIIEAKNEGYIIESPIINLSKRKAFHDEKNIYLPLILIKGLGKVAVEKIFKERSENGIYKSFFSFVSRLNFVGITKSIFEKLILSNTLRNFGTMKTLLENLNKALAYSETIIFKDKNGNKKIDPSLSKELEMEESEKDISFEAENENKYLGMVFNAFSSSKYETGTTLNDLIFNIEEKVAFSIQKINIYKLRNKNQEYVSLIFGDRTKTIEKAVFYDIENYRTLKVNDVLVASIVMIRKNNGLVDYNIRKNWKIVERNKKEKDE